jgi:hypothetical protein
VLAAESTIPTTRRRPAMLRALGNSEPPTTIIVDGVEFFHRETFKHDMWAATSLYENSGRKIVCKINRCQSLAGFPLRWLGRWLANREWSMLNTLAGVPGIPRCYRVQSASGSRMPTAAAHDYIEGQPLSRTPAVPEDFFDNLQVLLQELHRRQIAYIDLHKPENILVSTDGRPHLVDFQISIRLPRWWGLGWVFRILADSDRYHLSKHRRRYHVEAWHLVPLDYPWWIRLHRKMTIPLRTARRRILVALGIRKGSGQAETEVAPEVGLR